MRSSPYPRDSLSHRPAKKSLLLLLVCTVALFSNYNKLMTTDECSNVLKSNWEVEGILTLHINKTPGTDFLRAVTHFTVATKFYTLLATLLMQQALGHKNLVIHTSTSHNNEITCPYIVPFSCDLLGHGHGTLGVSSGSFVASGGYSGCLIGLRSGKCRGQVKTLSSLSCSSTCP